LNWDGRSVGNLWAYLRIWLVVALCCYAAAAHAQLTLGRIKSLFAERFTRFIDWPPGALPDGTPFVVCIEGTGETADSLFELARSAKWKGHLGRAQRVHGAGELAGCHLLYLSPSEAPRLPQLLKAVADKPILTVSDGPGFAEQGVLVNLYEEQGLMKFEINLAAVKRTGLVFSSQLLRLGRLVGGDGAPTESPANPEDPARKH
jgi:hypothetical protein